MSADATSLFRETPAKADQPAAQRVLDALRSMIVRGELAPGGRIVERTLCAKLDVSRTPMREALKLLEIDGLIELSQNRGARVRPFTEAEALDLFEVLAALESLAAELATRRISPSAYSVLKAEHAAMEVNFRQGDLDGYFGHNSTVHEIIVAATGNETLVATHKSLTLRAKRGRYMAILDPRRWREAMEEHRALMDAMERQDAEEAGRIWNAHLSHTGQSIAGVLRSEAAKRAVS